MDNKEEMRVLVNFEEKGKDLVFHYGKLVDVSKPVCVAKHKNKYKRPVMINIKGMLHVLEKEEYDTLVENQKQELQKISKEKGGVYVELIMHKDGKHVVEALGAKDLVWFGLMEEEDYKRIDQLVVVDGKFQFEEKSSDLS